ncbi:class I SAM-dependent methyltransferase [Haladaptatus sp.]|uniref:class I SAM-dependent methyltransferase n=1 Tax=Haladaptatus sp. TaxID=1973141 RepID=UPI003C6B404B
MTDIPVSAVSNETIVATYDWLAKAYDWFIAPMQTGTRKRALNLLAIESGEQILEVGCGPGHALTALARHVGPTGHVIGLDAAPRMVERARHRSKRKGMTNRIDLLRGDARSLPIREGTTDVAFIEDTLELFSPGEMHTVINEIKQVLEPDGRLGVVTMERADSENDPFVQTYDWMFDHVPGYERVGCRPVYARRALEEGGFEIERQERHRRWGVWPAEILIGKLA